jgi:hypothetical protein
VGDRLAHGAVTRRPPISLNTMYHPVPGATRTTLGFGICPSFKDHSLSTQVCSAMKRYVPDSPEQIEFYLKEAVDNLLYMSSVLSHPEVHYEVCPALTPDPSPNFSHFREIASFGWAIAHEAVSRRPPLSLSRDCSPYRGLHVRRESLGFVHRSGRS